MPYDQELIKEAIKSATESREDIRGEKKDLRDDYIGVYELHGELPLSYLTGKESDDETYRQQMHVIFINGDDSELTLYSGKEEKDPYLLTHLIEEEDRTLSIGAVEHLFDSQWMVNHSAKQIKDQLDLASKMVLQTADDNFLGKNVLNNLETGDILFHAENKPLTQVNNQSHDTPAISNYLEMWKRLAREIASTPEAVTGETMPSGTPYSQTALLNQEIHNLFGLMTENKGLAIEEMMREFVIPFWKRRKLNNSDEVAVLLEGEELENLDELDLPIKLEQELKNRILGGQELGTIEEMTAGIKEQQKKFGNTRFLKVKKTWKQYLADLEDSVEVEVTGENSDKQATLTTLNTLLQTVAGNPQILVDPNGKMLFNAILAESGVVSPVQLKGVAQQAPPVAQAQQVGTPQQVNQINQPIPQ